MVYLTSTAAKNMEYLSSACEPKHSCTKELVSLRAGAVVKYMENN